MQWRKASGFDARRLTHTARHEGFAFKVTRYERINGQFILSPFYHAYIDNDYLGYAATADAAKLICVLNYEDMLR